MWYKEAMIDDKLIKKLKTYIRKNYVLTEESAPEVAPVNVRGRESFRREDPFGKFAHQAHRPSRRSFEDFADVLSGFIRKEKKLETFSVMLERLRKERELTPAQLYNGAWIKKQLYSKIMGERNYHPAKSTAIAFGFSLKLDQDTMDELLETAGYRFSKSSITDLVVLFCLDQGLYDLHDINALLLSADQKVLCRE